MNMIGPVSPATVAKLHQIVRGTGGRCIDPLLTVTSSQVGPNCGFYALKYVLDYWYQKSQDDLISLPKPTPARKLDRPGATTSLRQMARQAVTPSGAPLSYIGELFSARALADVAVKAGYRATVHRPKTGDYLRKIYDLIDAGVPAIVPVDVDADATKSGGGTSEFINVNKGCPGRFGGANAHWVVIVGYFDNAAGRHLLQMTWENYYRFPAENLRASSNQLVKFGAQVWQKARDGHRSPDDDPGDYWNEAKGVRVPRRVPKATSANYHTHTTVRGFAVRPPPPAGKAKGETTLTTYFPDVNLDLRNQIVEVRPPVGSGDLGLGDLIASMG
jgi:hypothetical protein